MFKFISADTKQFEADLKTFAKSALPFATRSTLNGAAFMARGAWQDNIRSGFVTRNKFTERSIRVEKATSLRIASQESVVGSIAPYMATQEDGGTKVKNGTEGVSVATSYSSGEGMNTKPRTRLPRRPNKMASIQLSKRKRGSGGRKSRNAAAINMAAKSGSKFVFLDLERRKGIFKVIGGVRRPRIRMVWDMTKNSVNIPKHPTLAPAVVLTEAAIPQLYHDALIFQAKRRGLFRG